MFRIHACAICTVQPHGHAVRTLVLMSTSCHCRSSAQSVVFQVASHSLCASLSLQFLWSLYQAKVKKSMHSSSIRSVNSRTARTGTQEQLAAQAAHLAAAGGPQHMTPLESFSGPVPKTLKGGKRYWRAAFIQIMAMCVEYGPPEFFLTLTANEMGWADVRRACGGLSHGSRPVEATRHYHHRWQEFKARFLTGPPLTPTRLSSAHTTPRIDPDPGAAPPMSHHLPPPTGNTPIGDIERMWYRHEEQGRGSLHVHAAIWVRAGTARPEAIYATAPRGRDFDASAPPGSPASDPTAGMTAAEREWRQFIMSVQLHECQEGCHWRHGQRMSDDFCKTGYPRKIWTAEQIAELHPDDDRHVHLRGQPMRVRLNTEVDRYEYLTILQEDERLSTYVPLWSLAWGANMNIQYCTAAGFLSYISKYVPKPEPSGAVADNEALRDRENRSARQVHPRTHAALLPPASLPTHSLTHRTHMVPDAGALPERAQGGRARVRLRPVRVQDEGGRVHHPPDHAAAGAATPMPHAPTACAGRIRR